MKSLVNRKETIYFILLLITSIPMYALLLISGIGVFILGVLVIIPIIANIVFTAQIRTNGVKITEKQFPEVFERTKKIAKDMGFYFLPDIYVTESGGLLNAFATRFFGRNMIVLYSDLFEAKDSDPSVLDFVIAHELAHIKRNHILKHAIILPANWVPFLGSAYSRACEYTVDRMASHYLNDFEASTRALTMLAVGRKFYETVDQHEYMNNSSHERGFFIWLSEKLMTHPTLPKRIAALYKFHNVENPVVFKTSKRVFFIGIIVTFLAVGAVSSFVYFADKYFMKGIEAVFSDGLTNVDDISQDDSATPLMNAVSDNNLQKAKKLIQDGADVNATNSTGQTSLIYTTYTEDGNINLDMLKLLLESGADPNKADDDHWTILHSAVSNKDKDATELLLQYKANINKKDIDGETPIFETIYNDDDKLLLYLFTKGADLKVKNNDGQTLKAFAKEQNAYHILDVLKRLMPDNNTL